jgi:DNA invertase Pin-like site-specific DNA recombinase
MTDARSRKFDDVVCWKLDRWGRSLVHCVSGIQDLTSLGIRFIAVSQGLDTAESNPTSKLLMHILASVAEFERSLIKEQVAAGIKAAQKTGTRSGKPIGRPKILVDRVSVVELRYPKYPIRIGFHSLVQRGKRKARFRPLLWCHRGCPLGPAGED